MLLRCRQRPGKRRPKKLAEAVFLSLAFGKPVPFEVIRWELAERFGWTLEYIDSLSLEALGDYTRIQDARAKAAGARRQMNEH